jgi:hypothetical protein
VHNEGKPREYGVVLETAFLLKDDWTFEQCKEYCAQYGPFGEPEPTHVIEYSAYQALNKECDELKKWNEQQRIYFDEIASLRESLKGALWALEQYEKYGACSDANLRSKVIKAKHGELK